MDFKSSPFMYILGAAAVLFLIVQSLFFMIKAIKQGKKIGITTKTIKDTIISSALFAIAPSIAILATVLTLSASLGTVLPWIRLSVIGNISYEVTAAESATGAFGLIGGIANEIKDPKMFAAIAWVMTIGSILPLVLLPIMLKKIQNKVGKVANQNSKWTDVMSAAAFIGLIAAFIGRAISGKGDASIIGDGAGVLSVATLISSVLFMLIIQTISKKRNIKWLEPFAMPFSMFAAMFVAILLAQVLPHEIAFFEWRG